MAVQLFKPIFDAQALRPLEKLVLLRLADRVNGQAYAAFQEGTGELPGAAPGLRSLARDCSMSKQGVANTLKRLSARGVVRIREGSRQRPSTYFVLVQPLANLADPDPARVRRVPPGGTSAISGVLHRGTCEPAAVPPVGTPESGVNEAGCPIGDCLLSHGSANGAPWHGTEPVLTGEIDKTNRRCASELSGRSQETQRTPEPPYRVYAAIATWALDQSLRVDGDESVGNVKEWFKRRCSEQALPYDAERAGKAVEVALGRRDASKEHFHKQFAALAFPKTR